ncbi:NDR1/HIN1-like protein 10 [Primulina tabacum]|uniref:NDR1/HIN1-like protein 10 n=1 Tax=Primulina tabacum TaxID=48773 RepID=UPI003F5A4B80
MFFRILDDDRFRFYCFLLCVFIVLSVACVLSWLSLTPKNPRFQISDTRVLAFDSNNNQSAYRTDKYLMFNLKILNPNKRMGIFYSGITLNLYEPGCCIVGTNSTPAFYQGYKNTTSLDILIHPTQEGSKAETNGGNIDYIVGVQTYVRFRIMRWKTKLHQIDYKSIFHVEAEHESGEAQAPAPAGVEIKATSNINLTF